MEKEKFEAFHKIEGVSLNTAAPVDVGAFTFYNYNLHKSYLLKKYFMYGEGDDFNFVDNMMKSHDTWVSAKLESQDEAELQNEARLKFELLQNVLRFLVSFLKDNLDVGIYNYKKWNYDEIIIFKKGRRPGYKSVYTGAVGTIDLLRLIDGFSPSDRGASPIGERAFSARELIKKSGETLSSALDRRIMSAINLFGRAFYNFDSPICFLESMTAIEALISSYNKSSSSQIAEYGAFLLTDKYESRIMIEAKLRKFYKIRSKLAHGTTEVVLESERSEIMLYVKRLILIFLTNNKIRKMNSITSDDKLGARLDDYIKKLRYK